MRRTAGGTEPPPTTAGDIVPRVSPARRERSGIRSPLPKMPDGFLVIGKPDQQCRDIIEDIDVAGLEREGRLVGRKSAVELFQAHQSLSELVEEFRLISLFAQSETAKLFRLFPLLTRVKDDGEVHHHRRIGGVQQQGLSNKGRGGLMMTGLIGNQSQQMMGVRVVTVSGDDRPVTAFCFIQPHRLLMQDTGFKQQIEGYLGLSTVG